MNLGQHHPSLVVAMTPDLLSLHSYFESVEPDINDPACILAFCTRLTVLVNLTEMFRYAVALFFLNQFLAFSVILFRMSLQIFVFCGQF